MSKPDWKAHALGFMAAVKSLLANANAPMWLGTNFAIVPKSYLSSLEGHVERLEEVLKSEHPGVSFQVGTYSPPPSQPMPVHPPIPTVIPARFDNLERQVGNLEKQFSTLELTMNGVTRNLGRMDRELARHQHNIETLVEALFPMKKGKKPKAEKETT